MANVTVNGKNYMGVNEVRLPVTGSSAKQSFIIPEGTRSITANGSYDVSGYANAQVDVPSGGITPSGTKNITANGTYDVTEYASAQVSVSGGGSGGMLVDEGSFTTDAQGSATISCGFRPDALMIFVGSLVDAEGNTYDSNICVSFADLKAGHYAAAVAYDTNDNDSTALLEAYFYEPTTTGVAFVMYATHGNWGSEALANGTFSYKAIKNGEEIAPPAMQEKTVTPSENRQVVSADSGYDGLSQVTVNAISATYVGSGVTRKGAATYTPRTSDQTISSGQYLTGAQTIKGDANLAAANIKSGVSIFGVTGSYAGSSASLQSKTVSPTTSQQTVTPDSGYDGLSRVTVNPIQTETKIAVPTESSQDITPSSGKYLTRVTVNPIDSEYVGSAVSRKAAATITPGTADQTIAADQYLTGAQTVKGDAGLVAGNIRKGASIFGVSGSFEGEGSTAEEYYGELTMRGSGTAATTGSINCGFMPDLIMFGNTSSTGMNGTHPTASGVFYPPDEVTTMFACNLFDDRVNSGNGGFYEIFVTRTSTGFEYVAQAVSWSFAPVSGNGNKIAVYALKL